MTIPLQWYLESRQTESSHTCRFPLHPLPLRAGRRWDLDLVLPFPEISAEHAEILEDGGRLWVRDLGSTNGTFVNGRRIEWATAIGEGDVIQLAVLELRVGRAASMSELERATVDLSESVPRSFVEQAQRFSSLVRTRAFDVLFQPIVSLRGEARPCFEVLARGSHRDLPASPAELLAIAARLGAAAELSRLFRCRGVEVALCQLQPGTGLFLNTHPSELQRPAQLLRAMRQLREDAPRNNTCVKPRFCISNLPLFICTSLWDSVSSPAVGKNVIAVGATENDRPSPEPSLACRGCFDSGGNPNARPPDVNATHVGRVASFSGRGRYFGPFPADLAHKTRIKPDLVAPGVRVFSTVPNPAPDQSSTYNLAQFNTGCAQYYYAPNNSNTYHTYGTGTSFSAPVVSGVAALARKWFLDRQVNPAPSLLKAAMIATANTLGGSGLGGHDHRPSPLYGWGRVNLDRLTDSRPRFYVTESPANSVATGGAKTYFLKATNNTAPAYIVLSWSDPAAAINTNPQAVLINDLSLSVAGGEWRGNIFNESITGVDNGFSYRFTIGVAANDSVNNVEAVFIPAGDLQVGQVLQVTVLGYNIPQGPQSFSLYAYNLQAN